MREKYKTAPGHLDLDAFRKKVAEHFGMEPLFTNATLVVATDGLSKGLKLGNIHLLQKSGEHETINIALERMKELAVNAHGENWRGAAGTVADFARGQTKDDITLMAMPLIAGRGDPVALAVADGYGKKGEFASWRGINTFEAVLKQARENAASQMASEEQRRADEAERLEMHEHNRSADTQEHLAAELRQMPLPGSEVVNVTELLTHVQRGRANS